MKIFLFYLERRSPRKQQRPHKEIDLEQILRDCAEDDASQATFLQLKDISNGMSVYLKHRRYLCLRRRASDTALDQRADPFCQTHRHESLPLPAATATRNRTLRPMA